MIPSISPEWKDLLDVLSSLAALLGIPAAIWVFLLEKRRERRERENEAHAVSNERYTHYLELCLQYPAADAFDLARDDPRVVASGIRYEQLVLFTILISMLETAFLRYQQQGSRVRRTQGQGWYQYMQMWADRPDFRRAWPILGPQFETSFVAAMDEIIGERTAQAALQTPPTSSDVAPQPGSAETA